MKTIPVFSGRSVVHVNCKDRNTLTRLGTTEEGKGSSKQGENRREERRERERERKGK